MMRKGSKFSICLGVPGHLYMTTLPLHPLYLPKLERSGQVKGKRSSNNLLKQIMTTTNVEITDKTVIQWTTCRLCMRIGKGKKLAWNQAINMFNHSVNDEM